MHKWKDYSTKDLTNDSLGLFTTLTFKRVCVCVFYRLAFLLCVTPGQGEKHETQIIKTNKQTNQPACSTPSLIPHSLSSAYIKPQGPGPYSLDLQLTL